MYFGFFSVITIVLTLAGLFVAFRLLKRFSWILAWLRGTTGILMLAFVGMMVAVNLDLMSYKHLLNEKPILNLTFEKVDEQRYKVRLVYIEEGIEEVYDVAGDQWQIDAKIIRWHGIFQTLGAKPAYRLDRLSGRYYSLEDERRKTRTVHQLSQSEYIIDLWAWLKGNGRILSGVDAVYGSATYLPMSDKAAYRVLLSHNGLTAEPVNLSASNAINQFK